MDTHRGVELRFGGTRNKRYRRDRGGEPDWEAYEVALHRHWWFFLVTTPVIGLMVVSVLFLAFTKPF